MSGVTCLSFYFPGFVFVNAIYWEQQQASLPFLRGIIFVLADLIVHILVKWSRLYHATTTTQIGPPYHALL